MDFFIIVSCNKSIEFFVQKIKFGYNSNEELLLIIHLSLLLIKFRIGEWNC